MPFPSSSQHCQVEKVPISWTLQTSPSSPNPKPALTYAEVELPLAISELQYPILMLILTDHNEFSVVRTKSTRDPEALKDVTEAVTERGLS